MDVEAGHAVVGRHHLLKGPVREGEQGVAAEHGADHVVVLLPAPSGKVGVLPDGLAALLHAVPLADLVAQAGPDAHLPTHILDGEQGTGDLPEGGVVVKDGGDAVPDAVQHRGVGAGPGAVQGQMAVDVPPGALQHLQEVGGVIARDGQAPGQAAVDVGVGIDEARQNDLPPGVHKFRSRVLGPHVGQGPYLLDGVAVDDHRSVGQVGTLLVPGEQFAVADQQHSVVLLLHQSYRWVSRTAGYKKRARTEALPSARAQSTPLQP